MCVCRNPFVLLRSSASWTRRPVMSWVFFSMSSPKSSNTSFTFFSNLRTAKKNTPLIKQPVVNPNRSNQSQHIYIKVKTNSCLYIKIASRFYTLSIGELLPESVSGDDQHPLDPPEQHDVITLQLYIWITHLAFFIQSVLKHIWV